MATKNKMTLTSSLDADIRQVVRKFEESQLTTGTNPPLEAHKIYEYIRKSNSSLNRKNKKLLQDSIERVLSVLAVDQNNSDSEGFQADQKDPDIINRSIARAMTRQNKGQGQGQDPKKRDPPSGDDEQQKSKRKKQKDQWIKTPAYGVTMDSLGAVGPVLRAMIDLTGIPLLAPGSWPNINEQSVYGILLHGPPGCGKTSIANAFAARLKLPFIPISTTSIVSGISGESEKKLKECFQEAARAAPSIIFIDEIDTIAGKRDSTLKESERRIVTEIMLGFDMLAARDSKSGPVVVVAATNRADSLDPGLRRGGRFDTEISIGVPDERQRLQILEVLVRGWPLAQDIDLKELARRTGGYVGADLKNLVNVSVNSARERLLKANMANMDIDGEVDQSIDQDADEQAMSDLIHACESRAIYRILSDAEICLADFLEALQKVKASCTREGFAIIPETTWAEVGALHGVRDALKLSIVLPILDPGRFKSFNLPISAGILLWGPPGCGKTLVAKAVANESKANFIAVKGPELLSKYVGDSEKAVRQIFSRAKLSAPCVVFFDEFDALVPSRAGGNPDYMARVVNTMLAEFDGLTEQPGIFVIAATNQPDVIEPALLRPGRLGKKIYIGLPNEADRAEILAKQLGNVPCDVDILRLARRCDRFSGADIMGLIHEAKISAIVRGADKLEAGDFEKYLDNFKRSVSEAEAERYEMLRETFGTGH